MYAAHEYHKKSKQKFNLTFILFHIFFSMILLTRFISIITKKKSYEILCKKRNEKKKIMILFRTYQASSVS